MGYGYWGYFHMVWCCRCDDKKEALSDNTSEGSCDVSQR